MSTGADREGDRPPTRPPLGPRRADGDTEARRRAWARIAAVVAVTLFAIYVARLAEVGVATRRAERAEEALAGEVTAIAAEVEALGTAAADAQSDGSVERWAREERGWTLPGDRPILLVQATATAGPGAEAAPTGGGALDRFRAWIRERLP